MAIIVTGGAGSPIVFSLGAVFSSEGAFMKLLRLIPAIASLIIALTASPRVAAEVDEVKIAAQFGLAFLPLMVMQDSKLIEKHAKEQGIPNLKVNWARISGAVAMNDALLSGNLHFASGGIVASLLLWDRTKGTFDARAVAAMNSFNVWMNTRNPNIRTIRDLTDKSKIATAAPKLSIQALVLQMAAEKEFGPGNHTKLDSLQVTMSQPDALAALVSGIVEIDNHLAAPPFQQYELKYPGIRTVLRSYDVLGGPATFNVVWATGTFRDANPKTYAAVYAALEEAIAIINKDKRAAAETYLHLSKDKATVEEIYRIMVDPDYVFTTTPQNVIKYAEFMHRVGTLKTRPTSWRDVFFSNAHHLPGS
jgi:NitT/TauT family transport system substrate-binding protein